MGRKESEWAIRWNLRTEKWERKPVGSRANWEEYNRDANGGLEREYDDDEKFIKRWAEVVKLGGSTSDVAKTFCVTGSRCYARKRALNEKLRKQLGLPKDHDVLPHLPNYTEAQRERIRTHFTPPVKPLTLAEKLQRLPRGIRMVLNLPKGNGAK